MLGTSGSSKDRKVKTLILCNPERTEDLSANDSAKTSHLPTSEEKADLHVPPLLKESLWKPEGECSHTVEDLKSEDIVGITTEMIKLDGKKIEDNFNKRQIPRFR